MTPDSLRDPHDRRTFVERCARYAFGLSVLPFFGGRSFAADVIAEATAALSAARARPTKTGSTVRPNA